MNRHNLILKYQNTPWFDDITLESFDQKGRDDDTLMHIACLKGNHNDARFMLNEIKDIHLSGDIGNTFLHYACMKGHLSIMRLLIEKGADPNVKNDYDDDCFDFSNNHSIETLNYLKSLKYISHH